MNEMEKVPIGQFIKESYFEYGKHKNLERDFNQVGDGLKPVYRRLIYTYFTAGDDLHKTASIVGECMKTMHPHSDKAMADVCAKLVQYKICEGQGNWGYTYLDGESSPAAAMRYTEAKLAPLYRKLFNRLIDIVPYKNAEVKGSEPEFLPTPVPICLTTSSTGIGIGANQDCPIFSFKSLYEAQLFDDPSFLRGPEGLDLIHEESDIQEFWTTGKGRLTYRLKTKWEWSGDAEGAVITGNNVIFNPNLAQLEEWRSDGYIFYRNETDMNENRIFYARNKGVRKVSDDDIWDAVQEACTFTKYYRLNVSDRENLYCIPLREWLHECNARYIGLLDSYKATNIEKIDFQIEVYEWLPKVLEILIREWTRDYGDQPVPDAYDVIHEELGVRYEIITAIGRKSISTLKRVDSDAVLEGLRSERKYYEDFDSSDELDKVVKEFTE